VVIWGYLTATLPSRLIQSTDQHALEILKSPFRRGRHHTSTETAIFVQTPKQQTRSHVLAKFIKMLSDQQLITGLLILIAAFSSRCVISLREWRIVTSLAYFSATTHSLSLDVLRSYLAQHAWVRYCRITFTMVFLVLFTLAFLVDHLRVYSGQGYGYFGYWIVQCALQGWKSDPRPWFAPASFLTIMPIMILLWGKHISAVCRIAASGVDYDRHVTATTMDRMSMYLWSWNKRLSTSESARVVVDARLHYDNKIIPSNDQTRISVWYFLEKYHETFLSEIPLWAFQFAYGTPNTIQAVLGNDAYISKEVWTLGFGQVVAFGLLVLPLLALADIVNGQFSLLS
jgi:hypothetical protein